MLELTSQVSEIKLTRAQGWAKRVVHGLLKQLKGGQLVLVEQFGERYHFGEQGQFAEIHIHHPDFYTQLVKGGSIAAGEIYIDGLWDSPDLTAVVQLIAENMAMLDRLERKVGWLTQVARRVGHLLRRNSKTTAKANIAAHYDLSNALYQTFLDEQMLYSAGIYHSPEDSLFDAQQQKMARLCEQLELKASDHVLEIGTGWGAMAIYMAKHYGCHVTTTTISQEQYLYAKAQVEAQGLSERITLLMQDYRDLTGLYDKIVSIEMIEAVGQQYLPTYFQACQSLLKPKGRFAMQAITIADQRAKQYQQGVDFIQQYIFPGGFLPSISQLLGISTQQTDFALRDLQDIGQDYALTLKSWHQAFRANQEQVLSLGFDHQFIRLWQFYLSYCEGGFLARSISTVQLTWTRLP
ncbi:Tuberculostearic acid methyltransferase UfaA1 [Vibrio stylophorae]|uniref:Tuberculostearic acid methyltransferase UfaA1 n=1 Tax=Vibrio stylophorae TaxID=659351 RepID=A0ABN8DX63_9VIBR|nr:cyclopropane-fatty-acyl-phospholipid synthase family protein [Vibrio stylophorae]CAH0535204.1 Tuberculostearic acid methyltransferase UfaA1 [Vibrio stylophorae]